MKIVNPLRRREAGPDRKAALPADTRVYAIGDIHGRADLLRSLHAMIAEDAARASEREKIIVYLGDYIDRGLESRAVIDLLIGAPPAGVKPVHLMGNHEAMLLRFLEDASVGPAWVAYGGAETLYSYGVAPPSTDEADGFETARRALAGRLPERHRAFLAALPAKRRIGDYLFVHAGVRPGVPIDEQDQDDLLWIRDPFLRSTADHGCIVVHGHSIRREVEFRPNRIGIDTGAYATGVLTALVLAGERRDVLQTGQARAA